MATNLRTFEKFLKEDDVTLDDVVDYLRRHSNVMVDELNLRNVSEQQELSGGSGEMTAPSSLVVTTGDYTIPSGSYALVTACCENGSNLTINGTEVQTSRDSDLVSVSASGSYIVPAGRVFTGVVYNLSGGVTNVTINGTTKHTIASATSTQQFRAGEGDTIAAGTSSISIVGTTQGEGGEGGSITTARYHLPSGTRLGGAAKKTISLFSA